MPRLTAFRRARSTIVAKQRQTEFVPSDRVVAVARVVDGVDDNTGAERLDRDGDLVKPAQDCAWEVAEKQVIAAGG
jgi:hypothetical protein